MERGSVRVEETVNRRGRVDTGWTKHAPLQLTTSTGHHRYCVEGQCKGSKPLEIRWREHCRLEAAAARGLEWRRGHARSLVLRRAWTAVRIGGQPDALLGPACLQHANQTPWRRWGEGVIRHLPTATRRERQQDLAGSWLRPSSFSLAWGRLCAARADGRPGEVPDGPAARDPVPLVGEG